MSYSISKQAFLLLIIVCICGLSFEGSICAVSEIGRTDAIIPSKSIVLPRKCIWVIFFFFDQIKHSRNENRVKKVWIRMGLLKDYNFIVGKVDKMTLTIEEKLETISLPFPHHSQSSLLRRFYSSGFSQTDYRDNAKLLLPPPKRWDLRHSAREPHLVHFHQTLLLPFLIEGSSVVTSGRGWVLDAPVCILESLRGQHPKHLVYEL